MANLQLRCIHVGAIEHRTQTGTLSRGRAGVRAATRRRRCHSGKETAVFARWLRRTKEVRRSQKRGLSGLDLTASAFAEPGLLSMCPHCQHPVQFSQLFSAAEDYADVLRAGEREKSGGK